MKNAIAAADAHSEPLGVVDITTDAIVFGYIAAWYASSGITPKPAMPGWGVELKHKSITVRNSNWTATTIVKEVAGKKVLGLAITEHTGHNSGGGPKRSWWIPLTAFANATLRVRGMEL